MRFAFSKYGAHSMRPLAALLAILAGSAVALAVGLTYFDYTPPHLAALPEEFLTHSSQHRTLDVSVAAKSLALARELRRSA